MTDAPVASDRVYRAVVGAVAALFRLQGYRFDVQGTEHLPAEGAAVLAANHNSLLDFTLVGRAARPRGRLVRFMAKRSLFGRGPVGWAMRRMGHIPVDRASGAVAYRRARRWLERGDVVGVFPEATISRSWLVKPLRRGAAALALETGTPLVPVVTWGGHRILTVDGHRSLRRRIPVTIRVGTALDPRPGESVAALTERLHEALSSLLATAMDAYPETPRDDEDRWWLPHDRGGTAPDPETAHALDVAAVQRIGDSLE
ncbi:MAG: lysophospholipid acyltransferase family protein [Aeromicrobium sp.]|uniref:lysophospholipid acyltransferase family protein n=1 Tax=Aeromicrobium sp. TaxID=1871063 RepID=UPI0025BA5EDA|nr:lysophospholipid acyltransferase family protein [Aeromicrobium sp.]MCK5891478.1 1-acyl-sn-glycerol-3-phosphate acyltransferase [Aeromicrobium sp.]MDF1704719.1 lysophospholipid acyltransferase family protein [Aeromicrobium sp.]